MNFSGFLNTLKTKRNFSTVKDLYEDLGGVRILGMTLRNFQQVESGQRNPSEKFFVSLLKCLPRDDYRDAILAYFETLFQEEKDKSIIEYIDQHLSPPVSNSTGNIYDGEIPVMTYSNEQLEFLADNPDAMRLHHRLYLWERLNSDMAHSKQETVNELLRLSLARKDKNGISPSRTLYRVPAYENAPPPAVRRATRYLYSMLKQYASEEGSHRQHISFAMQLVSPSVAKKILDQMASFKKWIQNVAAHDPEPGLVPFLFLSFGKILEEKEY